MEDFDSKQYFGTRKDERFTTDSPFLISSSKWLNDARLREAVALHSLRRNHPDAPATVEINDVIPVLRESWTSRIVEIETLFAKERRMNKALDAWFEESFLSSLTLESLASYPHNSVGDIFRRFLVANDYVPEFNPALSSKSQFEYFQKRLSQQHDLEHLLGGFGFEYIGEQAVTWMRHASYFRHLSPQLAGILNETYALLLVPQVMRTMLHYPSTMETVWDAISRGVKVGRSSDPIFMMKYEPVLHLTIPEAREALGYRDTVDLDIREAADVWAEGCKRPADPRLNEDLPMAAE